MMGWISVALIWRMSAKISDTAPGRTPIAAARPPLVLPGLVSPRSIILTSSMALSFPNFRNYSNSDYQKSSLTFISEYQKLVPRVGRRWEAQVQNNGIDRLGARALGRAAGTSRPRHVLFRD